MKRMDSSDKERSAIENQPEMCTVEQIAEKRRIAHERLQKYKKTRLVEQEREVTDSGRRW